jgi:hypothetical protein
MRCVVTGQGVSAEKKLLLRRWSTDIAGVSYHLTIDHVYFPQRHRIKRLLTVESLLSCSTFYDRAPRPTCRPGPMLVPCCQLKLSPQDCNEPPTDNRGATPFDEIRQMENCKSSANYYQGGPKWNEFIPDAVRLSQIFSQATAPTFFLGAIAAFVSLMTSRLSAVIDRTRYSMRSPKTTRCVRTSGLIWRD